MDVTYPTKNCTLRWYARYIIISDATVNDRWAASQIGHAKSYSNWLRCVRDEVTLLNKCALWNGPIRKPDDSRRPTWLRSRDKISDRTMSVCHFRLIEFRGFVIFSVGQSTGKLWHAIACITPCATRPMRHHVDMRCPRWNKSIGEVSYLAAANQKTQWIKLTRPKWRKKRILIIFFKYNCYPKWRKTNYFDGHRSTCAGQRKTTMALALRREVCTAPKQLNTTSLGKCPRRLGTIAPNPYAWPSTMTWNYSPALACVIIFSNARIQKHLPGGKRSWRTLNYHYRNDSRRTSLPNNESETTLNYRLLLPCSRRHETTRQRANSRSSVTT